MPRPTRIIRSTRSGTHVRHYNPLGGERTCDVQICALLARTWGCLDHIPNRPLRQGARETEGEGERERASERERDTVKEGLWGSCRVASAVRRPVNTEQGV